MNRLEEEVEAIMRDVVNEILAHQEVALEAIAWESLTYGMSVAVHRNTSSAHIGLALVPGPVVIYEFPPFISADMWLAILIQAGRQ